LIRFILMWFRGSGSGRMKVGEAIFMS
jgi:hypothetical protein